jgi:hypothetical protein
MLLRLPRGFLVPNNLRILLVHDRGHHLLRQDFEKFSNKGVLGETNEWQEAAPRPSAPPNNNTCIETTKKTFTKSYKNKGNLFGKHRASASPNRCLGPMNA